MYRHSFKQGRLARLTVAFVSSAALAISLVGCQTTASSDISDVTGSLGDKPEVNQPSDARRDVNAYRERYRANPKDPVVALQYGKALRATGERSQAVGARTGRHRQSRQQAAAGRLRPRVGR